MTVTITTNRGLMIFPALTQAEANSLVTMYAELFWAFDSMVQMHITVEQC